MSSTETTTHANLAEGEAESYKLTTNSLSPCTLTFVSRYSTDALCACRVIEKHLRMANKQQYLFNRNQTMKLIKEWSGVVALVAIILTWIIPAPAMFGASGTRMPNGISADSTSPVAGQLRGTTLTITGASTFGSTATFAGLASTSALKVGDEPDATTINGIAMGFCSFGDQSITASTTAFVHCSGATGVQVGDRILVQATSSFDGAFVIQAASSTATNAISLRVVNTGLGVADGTLGAASINFWAYR